MPVIVALLLGAESGPLQVLDVTSDPDAVRVTARACLRAQLAAPSDPGSGDDANDVTAPTAIAGSAVTTPDGDSH